jgi:hypothetical protein
MQRMLRNALRGSRTRRGGMETNGPEVRLGITNCGTEMMEIALEPWGEDYWLKPDESITIIAIGRADGIPAWPGNTKTNAPFDINSYPDLMAVYCNGAGAWVVDDDGNELESGYQRPEPPPPASKPSSVVYRFTGPGGDRHS